MVVNKRSINFLKFFIYVIVIVLINLAGTTLFFRQDLTENDTYSISEASQRVVSTLSEPLTIKVFFTKNLPAPNNNTEQYLHDLLEEYSIYANQYFNYTFYDVSPDEGDIRPETKENRELAENYGIRPVQIQLVEKDEIKFKKAYMGIVLIHGDLIEKIPTITSIDGLEYKLTTAIKKLNNKISALLGLPEKIKIKLFLSSSLKIVAPHMKLDNLSGLSSTIQQIVQNLNDKSYGKLEFQSLDPTQDPKLEELVKKYNILSLKWPDFASGNIRAGNGAIGLLMVYQDKAVTIPLLDILRLPIIGTRYEIVGNNELKEIISKHIESLIDINEEIGYLADHGTLAIQGVSPNVPPGQRNQSNLNTFKTLTEQNYSIKPVNLNEKNIPESLNSLVIVRPTEAFTEYELFQIDQFLMRGKNLALFLDSFREVMPGGQQSMALGQGPMYLPIETGLEKLLQHYGISIKRSYVMDENCYKQELPQQLGGGERLIYFAPVIKNKFINKDLGFIKNIKRLIAVKISPIEIEKQRLEKNGLTAHRLFASSEKSWEMSGQINLNPMFISPPPADEMKSLPLAYILEGQFPSYFAGKSIPVKKAPENKSEDEKEKANVKNQIATQEKNLSAQSPKIESEGELIPQGKPAKIFIMSSSDMLTDNILDQAGRSSNAVFVMNILDYLNKREEIAVMRSKEQRFNPLVETQAGTKTFLKSFNIAVLPVLVVIFGLFVWLRRHSRKKRILMMFQK
ncbi:MAG: ABC transporter permease [Desulfobacterales bacterium]|nr:Gldg family protein [Deltaproteobacteria bacterium]NNL41283.1 ABC transporter permease [Desulfobacterales bacterium]